METELRDMLRLKADEAFAPAMLPVSTASRAKRRRAVTSGALGLAVAGAVVAIIAGVGALTRDSAIDFATKIEPKRSLAVEIGGQPIDVTVGFGSVWAVTSDEIVRIDARSGKVVARIKTAGPARRSGSSTEQELFTAAYGSFAAGGDAMWIVARSSGTAFSEQASPISEPQPSTTDGGQPHGAFSFEAQPLSPGGAPTSTGIETLQARPGGPGVTSQIFVGSYSLFRIDPRTNKWKEVAQFESTALSGPAGLATGDGSVWVATPEQNAGGRIWRFDQRTGKLQRQITFLGEPFGVAFQGGMVWVPVIPGPQHQFVLKIDPGTNKVAGKVAIPDATSVRSIAAADEDVWVAGSYGVEGGGPFFVARIDATTGKLSGTIEVPANLAYLAAGGGHVWGIPHNEPGALMRITGNAFSGRFDARTGQFDTLELAMTVDGSRLWLGGIPTNGLTRYEF